MVNAVHAPHTCDGKVDVYSSEYFLKLVASQVYKERGVCAKCHEELIGFCSYTLAGVRLGVRYWFPQRQPAPTLSFDPPP